ncbi:CBS domain protein [Thioalkalivibrio nitratireducens DSM 14787]|uniref:CBS domain protein n=1 Tax=Thioalkalivibrio nitratireducens (strain DSM 14787 / UNIQEM 213 / ALEN2) TaxID=1255043 RepID=L0DWL3_THIND|nr:CBS domain-containing protein [Thioalkalivibrio nitratireducens]AGA33423.1 CBS domain protein [Thioalkalivibrio nitratireducens DSM 14787]
MLHEDTGFPRQTQIDLSDEDIRAAMNEIPGYLDISMGDFRELYQHAFRHALERLSGCTTAGQMMVQPTWTVGPHMLLDEVIHGMAERALKGLPVLDDKRRVVGVLTETDLLRHFGVATFTQFLHRYLADPDILEHSLYETPVSAIMTSPVLTVEVDARFSRIVEQFHAKHSNRLPVVDRNGVLVGVLSRKDFIHAFHLEGLV